MGGRLYEYVPNRGPFLAFGSRDEAVRDKLHRCRLGLVQQAVDLDGAVSVIPVDAQIPRGGIDSAGLLAGFSMRGRLGRISDPDPLDDELSSLSSLVSSARSSRSDETHFLSQ